MTTNEQGGQLPEYRDVVETARVREESRGHRIPDRRVRYYWASFAAAADENTAMAALVAHMHSAVLDHLHGEALGMERTRQRSERNLAWHEATQAAIVLHGTPARDMVLDVLRAWAVAEDEDRWVAQLPQCDRDCSGGGEFSQAGHRPDCVRAAAWQARYATGGQA